MGLLDFLKKSIRVGKLTEKLAKEQGKPQSEVLEIAIQQIEAEDEAKKVIINTQNQ